MHVFIIGFHTIFTQQVGEAKMPYPPLSVPLNNRLNLPFLSVFFFDISPWAWNVPGQLEACNLARHLGPRESIGSWMLSKY